MSKNIISPLMIPVNILCFKIEMAVKTHLQKMNVFLAL